MHHGHRASRPTSAPSCTVAPTARRFLAHHVGPGEAPEVGHRHVAPIEGSGGNLGPLHFRVTPSPSNVPARHRRGPVRARFPRIPMAAYTLQLPPPTNETSIS